jgi:putative transposase
MSQRYSILDQQGINFLTCTVVGWIDIFTRPVYKEIVTNSFEFCRQKKGLLLHGYVLMPNHLHLIASAGPGGNLSNIIRDSKNLPALKLRST